MSHSKHIKILVTMPPGSGRYPAAIGMGYAASEVLRQAFPNAEIHYGGCSSGCIGALHLALGTPASEVRQRMAKAYDSFEGIHRMFPLLTWYQASEKYVHDVLDGCSTGSLASLNNHLFIALTKFRDMHAYNHIESSFVTKEDVSSAMMASGHLIIWTGTLWRQHKGSAACDGGFTCSFANVPGMINIALSYEPILQKFQFGDYMLSLSIEKYDRLFQVGYDYVIRNKQRYIDYVLRINGEQQQ